MPTILLSIYTAVLLIRPMDWWPPILGWQLVTIAAVATIFTAFPQFLQQAPWLWNRLPELKMGAGWVLGATVSYLPILWLDGMNQVFQEVGKIYVYFFLIILLCRTSKNYRLILWTLMGCTIWLAIHAVLQHHRGYGFGDQAPLWRVRDSVTGEGVWQAIAFGTFQDPNDLCLVFIAAIPLLYAEFRSLRHPVLKALALLAIPLVGYGVWLTNSRGGYVGVFGMISAYLVTRLKGVKRWSTLTLSVLALTVFAPSRFAAGLIGQQDRSILWGDGIAMFKANPIFGVGFYDFQEFSSDHKVAHNTYVQVLAETGLVGYLPFFAMIYFSVVHLRRAINLGPLLTREDAIQLAALFSSAVGYLTSIYFLTRERNHLLYIVLGLMVTKALGVCRTPEMFTAVFHHTAKEWRTVLVLALGSVIFMWVTIRIVNAAG